MDRIIKITVNGSVSTEVHLNSGRMTPRIRFAPDVFLGIA